MFAQFTSPQQELTGACLQVSLFGPKDSVVSLDTTIGPPKARRQKHFLRICTSGQPKVNGDALRAESAGFRGSLETSDCWAFVLYSTTQTVAILGHAGRMQLQPTRNKTDQYYGPYGRTIVSAVMRYWQEDRRLQLADTRVVIVKGICGQHFLHNRADGKKKASPFRRDFPEAFVGRGGHGLDLGVVLQRQFQTYGITPSQIHWIGACTFSTPELGSFRRDKQLSTAERQNTVTVEWIMP